MEVLKMLSIKERGIEELENFKNRIARSYGMGKIDKKNFERLNDKVIELIEDAKGIGEKE